MSKKVSLQVRLSAAESKERILEATFKLLPKNGFSGTSFQMIADRCHISQSNVLYHFKTKEILLKSLLDKIATNNFALVEAAMRPEFDAFQRICVHVEKNLDWGIRFPEEAQIIILVYSEGTHSKEFSIIFKQILDRAQERILEYLLAGVREKIFMFSLNPVVLAKVIHNVLVGKFINLMAGRETGVKNYAEKEWKNIIASLTGYQKDIR